MLSADASASSTATLCSFTLVVADDVSQAHFRRLMGFYFQHHRDGGSVKRLLWVGWKVFTICHAGDRLRDHPLSFFPLE